MNIRLTTALLLILLVAAAPASARPTPVGTAFTYQGQLKQGGNNVNATADFQFSLWDAAAGPIQIGATFPMNNVTITNGLFTVDLDFGAGMFGPDARWLDIAVRSPAGSGTFTPLSPRQRLQPTPVALFALNAGNATSATTATTATTATNATQLNGQAASFYTNAGNLTGTLSGGTLLGTYGNPLTLSNTGNVFTGSGTGLTALNATNISTGTLNAARLPVPLTLSGTSTTHIIRGTNASSTGNPATGIYGLCTASTGLAYGVHGMSSSQFGHGVFGKADSANGITYGGRFESKSPDGRGVSGEATAITGINFGGYFQSDSTEGRGVYGEAIAASGTTYGGWFESDSPSGRGVYGLASAATGTTNGVFGQSASTSGRGVVGTASAATGVTYGGQFESASTSGRGVVGTATAATGGTYGGQFESASTSGLGVSGTATATSGTTYGVYGVTGSPAGHGVFGVASAATGTNYGVRGQSHSTSGRGVYGFATAASGTIYGVFGQASIASSGYGVYSIGDMGASGVKPFRIDHPSDPENKYLLHYATESPVPQNFYSGNVVSDATGYAWVDLPDYFEEINVDYKYQLTVIGKDFAQAIIAKEIAGNRFQIRTSAPGVKVSWRVEANRNDVYVRFKKPKDVVEKEGVERGTYQHPDLYGQPPEKGMNYDATRDRPVPVRHDQVAANGGRP